MSFLRYGFGKLSLLLLKKSLPPFNRIPWCGMVRCAALVTKARKSMVMKQVPRVPLYMGASAPTASDGAVYTRIDVARCRVSVPRSRNFPDCSMCSVQTVSSIFVVISCPHVWQASIKIARCPGNRFTSVSGRGRA